MSAPRTINIEPWHEPGLDWFRLIEAGALPLICFLAASVVALWAMRTSRD